MNDRDFITSIRDQCNTQLGAGGGDTGPDAAVNITSKPSAFAELGTSNGKPAETPVSPGQVVGVTFQCLPNPTAREMRWFGSPNFGFNRTSWAVFDSGGARIMGEDNVQVSGSLGWGINLEPHLKQLGAGTFTFAVAVNKPGNLAIQWQQTPR